MNSREPIRSVPTADYSRFLELLIAKIDGENRHDLSGFRKDCERQLTQIQQDLRLSNGEAS